METNTMNQLISPAHLLKHWQGHRRLTRRVIEAFPEKDLFEFSIGGMRPFARLAMELLAIGAPGIKEIATGESGAFNDEFSKLQTKAAILNKWDEDTEEINRYWQQISLDRFYEPVNLFGQYNFPAIDNIFYFIDNENHHRGQGYVYLRALGIEPPAFYDRS